MSKPVSQLTEEEKQKLAQQLKPVTRTEQSKPVSKLTEKERQRLRQQLGPIIRKETPERGLAKETQAARTTYETAQLTQAQHEFEAQKGLQVTTQTAQSLQQQARRIEKQAELIGRDIAYQTKLAIPPKPVKITEDMLKASGIGLTAARTGESFKETLENLQTLSDDLYDKSGLGRASEIDVEGTGYAAKYEYMRQISPKNAEEALNRLGYFATQAVIGVGQEGSFPVGLEYAPAKRESDVMARTIGGLLFPSAVDILAGQIIAKIAKTKTWRKLTGRYGEVNISELEKAAAREIEKLKGKGQPYSVAEIRAGVKKVYLNLEDVAEFYRKHPELATPEHTSAGSAQIPKVVQEFEDYLDDLGWDMDEYLNFMRERAPEMPAGALVSILVGVQDEGKPIEQTIIDLSNYTDSPDKYKFTEKDIAKLKDAAESLLDQPTKPEEEQRPLIDQPVRTDEAQEPRQDQPQEPRQDTPQRVEPRIDEVTEPLPPTEPETPTIPLTPKQQEEMRDIRLRLWNGPKERYRVRFEYPRGGSQALTVEARSFPEAVNRAQRARRGNRYLPSAVDVTRA